MTKRKYSIDEEWLSLIQECRSSGLTISNSAKAHQICPRKYKTLRARPRQKSINFIKVL